MISKHIDRINKKTMQGAVGVYGKQQHMLRPPEQAALDYVKQNYDIVDQSILDIGVGGGRTVKALREISKNYTGLDYVREMVDICKRKFPEVHFEQGDARDLSKFPDESFSLCLFSLNGICMVDHLGRIKILNEIIRVLKPGGYFLFSTYNQDNYTYRKSWQFPKFKFSLNPLKLGVRCVRFIIALPLSMRNRFRFKKLEYHSDEYSVVNDFCHNYSTFQYYITQSNQRKQLINSGFDNEILTIDKSGDFLYGDTLDDSIFYISKKPI